MTAVIRLWLVAGCLLLMAEPILAQEQVRIGIQAYRPKSQVQLQWQPLAAALTKAIPGYQFVIEAYDVDELTVAVASRQVDFVLTNPSQYVLMDHRSGISAPLASLSNLEQGKLTTSFGGVIFTRANHADIQGLADVRGKSVAIVSPNAFGGYQIEAYELYLAGLRMPQDVRLKITKPPQDNVIEAVLSGQADVGFVRSGVLESLAKEGRLNLANIKVINQQNLPGFPVRVSTRLYPEFMFASMPHIESELRRKVTSFLLNTVEDKALTQALGIHGFDVPADHTAVEEMLRELRLPPFEVAPTFTLDDVWNQYRWQLIFVLISSGLILFLLLRLLWTITKLRRAEDELRKSHEHLEDMVRERTSQLEAANKELEEFSYSMSHDMRTPLRALDGFSKILLEEHGTYLNDEGRRLLKVLRDNAQRMGRLVDDILHFLSMGRRKMEFGPVDIAKLASEIFTELQAAAPARRLRIDIETLPPAWGDQAMIREVLQNLLSNAVKFSPVGAETVIELGGAVEQGENVYSITDHGVGFDMRYADKLFRVFERVHPTGLYEGSGIGLALVKRIVGRHGGRVWAEGKVNEGATIYFSLPAKR